MIDLSNKNILVTGASTGIGKGISLLLNSLGANVIGVSRRMKELEEVKKQSANHDRFHPESRDLSQDIENMPYYIKSLTEAYGALDAMVLNAGIELTEPISISNYDKAKKLFDINYFANIALLKSFQKRKHNTGNGASVVLISSITANIGIPAVANYSASKSALNAAMRSVALEFAKTGLRINSILPGHILTEMTVTDNSARQEYLKKIESAYPLGFGKVEDVAYLAAFLISDKAKWITGQEFTIDGGASINFLNGL